MLLPYELGEFTIAPDGLLRQTRARPLDQGEVILVDRGGWHLERTRLMWRCLLVSNEQARPNPSLERPSLTTALPHAPAFFFLKRKVILREKWMVLIKVAKAVYFPKI